MSYLIVIMEAQQREPQTEPQKETNVIPEQTAVVTDPVVIDTVQESPRKKPKKNKKRCHFCSKKLTLAGRFECRCENVFCSQHRLAHEHECTFDFRAHDRQVLAEMNERVVADKVDKI